MNQSLCPSWVFVTIAASCILASAAWASDAATESEYDDEACIECHQTGSDESELHIDVDAYQASAHGQALGCLECHTNVIDDTHMEAEGIGAVTCDNCHPDASSGGGYFTWFPSFQIASHNKADFGHAYERTNCLGCHQGAGAHGEAEPINDKTCYKCHSSTESNGALWGKMHPRADRRSQPAIFAAASIYQISIVGGLVALLLQFFKSLRGRSKKSD